MSVLSIHSEEIQPPPHVKRHFQLRNTKTSATNHQPPATNQAFFQVINLPRERIIGYPKDLPNQQNH